MADSVQDGNSISRPIQSDLGITDYDDTAFGAGTLTWQDPVHSWQVGSGEVMTMENYDKSCCPILIIRKRKLIK